MITLLTLVHKCSVSTITQLFARMHVQLETVKEDSHSLAAAHGTRIFFLMTIRYHYSLLAVFCLPLADDRLQCS